MYARVCMCAHRRCTHIHTRAQAFHAQLVSGNPGPEELAQRFAALAGTESHCSSARRGGDLGPFG